MRDPARARAKLRGLLLILAPDGRCALCRKRRPLEIDHVDARSWAHSRLNFRNRVDRYLREYRAGVRLRALCRECNARDGWHRSRACRKSRDVSPENFAFNGSMVDRRKASAVRR